MCAELKRRESCHTMNECLFLGSASGGYWTITGSWQWFSPNKKVIQRKFLVSPSILARKKEKTYYINWGWLKEGQRKREKECLVSRI